ncbi:(2Fe-2S)-binding protein [Polaromonas glacialis]|uniref:(2Fe-2S)-binding protein n=1 Tax=Polaromonas glacialis TaxID=866564 RepID=UPI000A52B385|nr:(2Fe-2S)-binding protein [Polaromonas glacialis]
MPDTPPPDAARRNFLRGTAASGASIGLLSGCAPMAATTAAATGRAANAERTTTATAANVAAGAWATIHLTVNNKPRTLTVEPRTTLVDALRDTLGLTGTKIGCNHGQCGACTVLVDSRRSNSCLMLAVSVDGAKITTIEGLAGPDGALHPMQLAFAEKDAFQCGYCTPGQIISAVACIEEGHAGSAAEIREYMSGNLCRCAAYPNIVAAVEMVRDARKG